MSNNKPLRKPVAVAVEGADWFYFLLEQIKDDPEFHDVQLFDFGGISQLSAFLESLQKDRRFPDLRALGIIRDAEHSQTSAVQSIRSALQNNNLPNPEAPLEILKGYLNVQYIVVPYDEDSGCLETLLLQTALEPELLSCAEQMADCLDPNRDSSEIHRAKVIVHGIIAGSRNPAMTLGQSTKAKLWDLNHKSVRQILDAILNLTKSSK